VRYAGLNIQAKRAQPRSNQLRRLELPIPEFGMLMNLVPQRDHRTPLAVNGRTYSGVGDRGTRLNLGPGETDAHKAEKKSDKCDSDYCQRNAAVLKIQ
jgi:hypothetical protein